MWDRALGHSVGSSSNQACTLFLFYVSWLPSGVAVYTFTLVNFHLCVE